MENQPQAASEFATVVPLFPLPNVVLLPGAVLPLHIFEQRYKIMLAHALEGDRKIAMALLKPGWEKDYYHRPAIDSAVCVGRILTHEKLPDGKYNLLLQGEFRAQINCEIEGDPYRQASVGPIPQTHVLEIDLANYRQRLLEMVCSHAFTQTPLSQQLKRIVTSHLCTSDAADLLAFNFIEDIDVKQSILADGDVIRRVAKIVSALETALPLLESSCRSVGHEISMN
jgi:Lon protease-like protein